MKKQIRNLEEKFDSYQIRPDKEVRSQITDKRSKLLDKLWGLDSERETHDQEIEKLKKAKDSAFDLIREAKTKINEVVDALAEHDAYILKNRQSISIMNKNVTAIKQENRCILSQLQEHALKMNASNSFPATKAWMLQSDTNKYHILLAYQNSKFERFAPMLSQVKVGGDKIADVKRFYNNINVVMMTTLSSMHFLPGYKALTDTFDPATHILPPTLHTQYENAVNAYRQYGRALLLHL